MLPIKGLACCMVMEYFSQPQHGGLGIAEMAAEADGAGEVMNTTESLRHGASLNRKSRAPAMTLRRSTIGYYPTHGKLCQRLLICR